MEEILCLSSKSISLGSKDSSESCKNELLALSLDLQDFKLEFSMEEGFAGERRNFGWGTRGAGERSRIYENIEELLREPTTDKA